MSTVNPQVTQSPTQTPKQKNVLGRIAFILAIVGFIFAVWRGAFIIGWIVLPAAFVLSIVALVLRGKTRGLAIAALIISIAGTIAGFVAFFASVGDAITEAVGTSEVSASTQDPGAKATDTKAPDTKASDAAKQGTRENPYAIGATLSTDDWDVKINSFTANANAAVAAENQFNDAPAPGTQFALVNATLTYKGADKSTPLLVQIAYVTAAGQTITSTDALVVAPAEISPNELYAGGSTTGNVALQIPSSADGLIRVTPGIMAKDVFVALK